jgi:Lar family restriction alleviation protein
MTDLLPCPFCGSSNIHDLKNLDWIACEDCGAQIEDGEPSARELWNRRAPQPASDAQETPTKEDFAKCAKENVRLRTERDALVKAFEALRDDVSVPAWIRTFAAGCLPDPAQSPDDWQDDPAADERWNAGCTFALDQLCKFLGVDSSGVTWDAATETVDGDVQAVIGNILCAKYGENWGPRDPAQGWQDISTAPKDRPFIGWCTFPAGEEARQVCWLRTGFWGHGCTQNVTHWMEMPAGPSLTSTQSGGGK